jgi:uncharacterized membrane protein
MQENTTEEQKDKNNDDYYVWGLFYYNKDDKRLLPPKRRPWMGWTVNFANPYSILLLVAIIAAIELIAQYFRR